MSNQYSAQVQEMIHKANHEEEMLNLAGGPVFENEEEANAWKSPYNELLEAFFEGIKEVAFLQRHECKYGENDYCYYCHRDGRA